MIPMLRRKLILLAIFTSIIYLLRDYSCKGRKDIGASFSVFFLGAMTKENWADGSVLDSAGWGIRRDHRNDERLKETKRHLQPKESSLEKEN